MHSGDLSVPNLHTIRDPMVSAEPTGAVFEALLRAHEADLRAFLAAVVRQPALCDDLYQETARALWKSFAGYDGSRAFGAWARGVARHVVQQYFRNRAREGRVFSDESLNAVAEAWEDQAAPERNELLEALTECVAALPEEGREAVTRFYTGRERVAGIARHMGRSADAVYQLLTRSRARLAACVRHRMGRADAGASAE